jgi:hypothetical protein
VSRAACAGKPARAPPENPFAYFCNFPRRDFLDLEKGVSGGCAVALATLVARIFDTIDIKTTLYLAWVHQI